MSIDNILNYALKGWHVFPLPPGKKKPNNTELTFKHATRNAEIIKAWWTANPDFNVGIQPKMSGLLILDVDVKNNGHLSVEKYQPIGTRCVVTASGGKHYYFRDPGIETGNRIGILPGVDIIYDSNHVVAPPSITSQGVYHWEDESVPITEVPDWLRDLLTPKPQGVRTGTELNLPNVKGQISVTTMTFLQMGNTAAYRGIWNQSLFKAAKDYQQNNYTQDEFIEAAEKITGHLDHNDLTTIRSAFKKEPKYGVRINPNDPIRATIDQCHLITDVEDVTNEFFVNLDTGINPELDPLLLQRLYTREEREEYMANRHIRSRIDYQPWTLPIISQEKDTGIYTYNTYRPPFWRAPNFLKSLPIPNGPLPDIYHEFFTHLVNADLPSFKYLLDWLANSLRSRNYTILTAIGAEGIGKGVLGTLIQCLHGEENFRETTDKIFKERFNSQVKNKTLIYVDEISLGGKSERDRIKAVINNNIEIEAKGVDAETISNHASFYISSNHLDAIELDDSDRRFSIIQLTDKKLRDTSLISKIPEMQSNKNIEKLAWYLWNKPLEHNMLIPFRSARFKDVLSARLKPWEEWFIEEYCPNHEGEEWPVKEIQNTIMEKCKLFSGPTRRSMMHLEAKFPQVFHIKNSAKNEWRIEFLKQGDK